MVIYICCHLRGVGRELIEHRGDPELRDEIFISAENASLIFDLLFGEIFALDGSLYNAPGLFPRSPDGHMGGGYGPPQQRAAPGGGGYQQQAVGGRGPMGGGGGYG